MPEPFDLSKLDAWKAADPADRNWSVTVRSDHRPELHLYWLDSAGLRTGFRVERDTLQQAIDDAVDIFRGAGQP